MSASVQSWIDRLDGKQAADVSALLEADRQPVRFQAPPRFPAVLRDVAFIVPDDLPSRSCLALLPAVTSNIARKASGVFE